MRHDRLLTYMLLVGSIAIVSCGRVVVLGDESASQFPSAKLGVDTTKIAEIEQHEREEDLAAATAQAQAGRNPAVIPTDPPTPRNNRIKTGLTEDCRDVFPDRLLATNCWTGIVGEKYTSVFAGSLKYEPAQGVLIIYTTSLDGTSSSIPEYYCTVNEDGPITINKVIDSQIQVTTQKGLDLVFDLITHEWS